MNTISLFRFNYAWAILLAAVAAFLVPAASAGPAITTKKIPNDTNGVPYNVTLAVSGGLAPYTWTLASGGFPDGLSLNPAGGNITGTTHDTAAWEFSYPYSVYITVTDATGASSSKSYTLSLVAAPAITNSAPATNSVPVANTVPVAKALALAAASLPPAMAGSVYSEALNVSGGTPPYSWSLSAGALPAGLTLGTNTGVIAGVAIASGSWVFGYTNLAYIEVADAAGATAFQSYSLSVIPSTNVSYALTVNNGTGSGAYPANTTVPITAVAPGNTWVFTGWTGAAVLNPSSPATSLVMPLANVSVTANFSNTTPQFSLVVTGGSGSGTYGAGTPVSVIANSAPPGQVFQAWTGAALANPFVASNTLVMPSNNVALTAIYGASASLPAVIPQPVASHPRLWITTKDLPRLRSWATSTNPMYAGGVQALLGEAISDYQTAFFPGGVANTNYPDPGDSQGYTGLLTEQYLYILALNSLIDPNPTNRAQYAQYTRNLLMYAMNQAALGVLTNAPFRDPSFPCYNRANFTSEAWPLAVDWIYNATDTNGNPILSAADKATIRQVFLIWANECINADTTGGDSPAPVGTQNSAVLLPGGNAYRMAANNYYSGHARLLTMMALAMDPADDPAVNPALPVSVLGNSLRSYIAEATGAWLYQQYAMYGDPTNVCTAYGLATNASVGLASGGLPPEGMLYGHSYSFIFGELLALKTAGFADPALSGPQAALANDPPVWRRFVQGFLSSLVPVQSVPAAEPWNGLVYEFASYGDILRMFATPDMGVTFGLLGLLDQQNGDTNRLAAERWFTINAVQGGAPGLASRVSDPWTWGVQDTILNFLLLDPGAATPSDPRPAYATRFYDAGGARLVDRTDWTPGATLFDYRASWQSINHQQADAGQFEFYRNGEWLTKGVANYDNNIDGITSEYHNTLGLQNWCSAGVPTNLGWWEGEFWTNGSSWQLGDNAGDPATRASLQPGYDFLTTDLTPLYNRPSPWSPANAALDIIHASRSILWLKPDHIVVYDRATTRHSGLFKRFNLALTGQPVATNNVITTTTPGGQHLYVTELLPTAAQLAVFPVEGGSAIGELDPIADLEPSTWRLWLEDSALPADTRFLHVLQGADANVVADPAALFQSTAGTAMDGALFGNTAVLFIHDDTQSFAGVTYTVPVTATQHFVTGCVPGASYAITTSVDANGLTVTLAPASGGVTADAAGVVVLNF